MVDLIRRDYTPILPSTPFNVARGRYHGRDRNKPCADCESTLDIFLETSPEGAYQNTHEYNYKGQPEEGSFIRTLYYMDTIADGQFASILSYTAITLSWEMLRPDADGMRFRGFHVVHEDVCWHWRCAILVLS